MVSLKRFLLIITFISYSECAKILGILHVAGKSHYYAGSTLMKILANNGHHVTVVSPFGEKNPPKNYRDIIMEGVWEKREKMDRNFFESDSNGFVIPITMNFYSAVMVENLFNSTNFQKLMNSGETFDLVIIENFISDAVKYVAHHFKAPLIVYTPLETNDWINPYQGNPDHPAYKPVFAQPYTNEMTFLQRVKNTILYSYNQIIRVLLYIPRQNVILHKYFPDAPDLNEIISNVALVFANTDPSTHEPLPRVPSIIDIGGFHITEPKPLPNDIQSVLDNAKNGVIYFSLGSNLKSKDMPIEIRQMLMKVFAKFDETILWKFEDESLLGKPDNVIIQKWWPQNDILAHKNVKLFITHGGIFSTFEALYHGLPILLFPIFGDQKSNANRATANGYARWLNFQKMTEQDLESSLRDLLTNPKYTENAKQKSKILRDKPMTPQATINFWVDYVIRHKGTDHLKVASVKLCWYQYVLLDVIAFISLIFIVVSISIILVLKKIRKLFQNSSPSKMKKN